MTGPYPQGNPSGQWGPGAPQQVPPVPVAAPPTRSGVNPYIVSGTGVVLLAVSLIGFFLNWVKVVVSMSEGDFGIRVEGRMNGFGMLKLSESVTGSSETDIEAQYLILAILFILLLVVGIVVVLLRIIPVLGGILVALAGVVELLSAVLGLLGDERDAVYGDTAGISEAERKMIDEMLDQVDVTRGPGQYIVIVAGILLVALGALYALRGGGRPSGTPQINIYSGTNTYNGYPAPTGGSAPGFGVPPGGHPAWPSNGQAGGNPPASPPQVN